MVRRDHVAVRAVAPADEAAAEAVGGANREHAVQDTGSQGRDAGLLAVEPAHGRVDAAREVGVPPLERLHLMAEPGHLGPAGLPLAGDQAARPGDRVAGNGHRGDAEGEREEGAESQAAVGHAASLPSAARWRA